MIRALFYLVVFALGLAAGALWLGEMRHLRAWAPQAVPLWTAPVAGDATLRRGRAEVALPDGREITLEWRAKAPRGDGLHWDLILSGDGVAATADLMLPYWPDALILRRGRGTLAAPGATDGAVIRIEAIEGRLALPDRRGFVELRTDAALDALLPDATRALPMLQIDGTTLRLPVALP